MRAIAKKTNGAHLDPAYQSVGYGESYFPQLVIDESYLVYGMILWHTKLWYLIIGEYAEMPEWMPAELFDVIDHKVSRHWNFSFRHQATENDVECVWGYSELAIGISHFDQLLEGDPVAINLFNQYKTLFDIEFENPKFTEYAAQIDNDWIMCPNCIESWKETNRLDYYIICPTCNRFLRNPHYNKS